jgi:hypothetical protein
MLSYAHYHSALSAAWSAALGRTTPATAPGAQVTGGYLVAAVDLNGPGHYLHWGSIFTISVANLALVAVMVVLFAAALLIPFPGHSRSEEPTEAPPARKGLDGGGGDGPAPAGGYSGAALDDTDPTWTGAVRRTGLRFLPPAKLLPGRQPAFVASWIYVFGVGTLAGLFIAIVSGFAIALGGPDWWHTNPVGHFFNSLHLWSVEIFMAFMVIHLWGKFWMAAWRGRRALTWITGVLAFVASIVECFTGYLSQQNFDSQWISTNGKDAINSTGLGGFFNLMNFGQMLLWHVVLLPIVLVAVVGAHVLFVRVRGVAHPLPVPRARGRAARRKAAAADAADWTGPTRVYDIVKEAIIATAVVTALVFVLAGLLSSPDEPPLTIATWARLAPADFAGTSTSELAGTSETATYGPPYNNATGSTQRIGISWEKSAGVRIPVHPAVDFVLDPLAREAATNPSLGRALHDYRAATANTRSAWLDEYQKALTHVTFHNGTPVVPPGNYGPVPLMISTELTLARSGALDADLIAGHEFYGTDFTKPLLFMEDGEYFAQQASNQHLTGSQWGVMNETGSYPGQPWLWLYTLWYQLPGFDNSANVDMIAIYLTGAATLLLLALPFIPGLRDIPEVIPLHRVVWRNWDRRTRADLASVPANSTEEPTDHLVEH